MMDRFPYQQYCCVRSTEGYTELSGTLLAAKNISLNQWIYWTVQKYSIKMPDPNY